MDDDDEYVLVRMPMFDRATLAAPGAVGGHPADSEQPVFTTDDLAADPFLALFTRRDAGNGDLMSRLGALVRLRGFDRQPDDAPLGIDVLQRPGGEVALSLQGSWSPFPPTDVAVVELQRRGRSGRCVCCGKRKRSADAGSEGRPVPRRAPTLIPTIVPKWELEAPPEGYSATRLVVPTAVAVMLPVLPKAHIHRVLGSPPEAIGS